MSILRAARAALAFTFVATACLLAAPAANAQEPTVELTLVAQTPFTTLPTDPRLRVVVQAKNPTTQAFTDLSVEITVGQAIRSRDQYETTLRDGPGEIPLFAVPFPQGGTLEPGQTRGFSIRLDVGAYGVDPADSLVYPSRIDLLSGGTPLAGLNTPIVNIVRTPEQPVRLAWWAEVTAPPAFDPQGRLADGSFEAALAPEGTLGAEVEALRAMATDPKRGDPIDVAIQPSVLDQLQRMADGYTRLDGSSVPAGKDGAAEAAAVLASLRAIAQAPGVQISAMPFSAPAIPSLLSNGLSSDLARQRIAGDALVRSVLGIAAAPEVTRPPFGALDDASVGALVQAQGTTILADAATVDRPLQPNGFAPLPTASLTTPSGNTAQLVLPDPDTEALLQDPTLLSDPVRAAQAVFAEMATIWRESPVPGDQPDGTPTVRGIALALPTGLPAGLWGPLTRRLADAPFLQPQFAQEFVAQVNPPGPPATLTVPSQVAFSKTYSEGIRDERRDVDAYRSMLTETSDLPDQMDRDLLYAESGVYLGETGEQIGRAWIDQVHTQTEAIFSQVRPNTAQRFTFTSAVGTIPLQMGDPGPTPLKIIVQLRSAWFSFPDGPTQIVTLTRPNQVVSFRVEAAAGGQAHSIQLLVRSPSGRPLDQPQTLIVRTAAVNRIALLVTLAAALGLVVLWTRRLIRVRGSRRGA